MSETGTPLENSPARFTELKREVRRLKEVVIEQLIVDINRYDDEVKRLSLMLIDRRQAELFTAMADLPQAVANKLADQALEIESNQ